jgi:hypothetical protein
MRIWTKNDDTWILTTKETIMSVDYKKLLTRCMEQWIDSEGGCWNGDEDLTITEEEEAAIKEIYDNLDKQFDDMYNKNMILEDYDEQHGRIVRQ